MELNKIYKGDAYELIKSIPDGTIDLIITDPPYEYTSQKSIFHAKSDIEASIKKGFLNLQELGLTSGFDFSILKEFERICKFTNIYIWCNQKLLFKLIDYYKNREDLYLDLLVFGKSNPIPNANNPLLNDAEWCLFIHQRGAKWRKVGCRYKHRVYYQATNQQDKKLFNHPTPKPINILENFIVNSCVEGGGSL